MDINDWKIIQMRNDVKYIKRHTVGNNAASWSLVVDVFLILLAFVLDRVFSDSGAETMNTMWGIIAAGGVLVPVSLFIWEIIRTKRIEKLTRRVMNTKELVTMFDDEICYMIMSAETFYNNLGGMGTVNSRQKALLIEFYVIEAEYYLDKAVQLLLKMDNNLSAVLDENDLTRNNISKTRLVNAISLLASIYNDLFAFCEKCSNELSECSVYLNLDIMKEYYNSLKRFATERKDLIGIDVENVFKPN